MNDALCANECLGSTCSGRPLLIQVLLLRQDFFVAATESCDQKERETWTRDVLQLVLGEGRVSVPWLAHFYGQTPLLTPLPFQSVASG